MVKGTEKAEEMLRLVTELESGVAIMTGRVLPGFMGSALVNYTIGGPGIGVRIAIDLVS